MAGKGKRQSLLLSWIKQLLFVVFLTLFVSIFIIQTYDINDVSMMPTFDPGGNRVLVFVTPYFFSAEPAHGDILIVDSRVDRSRTLLDRVVESPLVALARGDYNDHLWVKRVIGLPGDRLEFNGGKVYRNGTALDEPYTGGPMSYGFASLTVPPEHFYVMGDNRDRSSDSRQIGPVPAENVQGRVLLRFFPFNKLALY